MAHVERVVEQRRRGPGWVRGLLVGTGATVGLLALAWAAVGVFLSFYDPVGDLRGLEELNELDGFEFDLTSDETTIRAIDSGTGDVRWERVLRGPAVLSPLVLVGELVIMRDRQCSLQAPAHRRSVTTTCSCSDRTGRYGHSTS